ncbi:hypothetical protein JOE11_005333 [Robbsia andropogonis]
MLCRNYHKCKIAGRELHPETMNTANGFMKSIHFHS